MNKYNPWEDIPVSRQFLCEESNKYNFWRYKQPTKNGYNFSFLFELKTAKDDVLLQINCQSLSKSLFLKFNNKTLIKHT